MVRPDDKDEESADFGSRLAFVLNLPLRCHLVLVLLVRLVFSVIAVRQVRSEPRLLARYPESRLAWRATA